jgi:hypothetical protein
LTFIAWELGQQQIFCTLVNRLVYECSMDSEGRLILPKGHCLDDYNHIGPEDLIGKLCPVSITYAVNGDHSVFISNTMIARICDVRRTTIQCLLNLLDQFITNMSFRLSCSWHKPLPLNNEDRLISDSMILGSFWKSTIKERGALFPTSADAVRSSVKTLVLEILNSLNGIICDSRHKECNPAQRLQTLAVDTVQNCPSPLTSDHTKYLRSRRAELGLANYKPTRAKEK